MPLSPRFSRNNTFACRDEEREEEDYDEMREQRLDFNYYYSALMQI